MKSAGFDDMQATAALYQVKGSYTRMTVRGWLQVTLVQASGHTTELRMHSTGNMDNIYALFSSPCNRILTAFEHHLSV